MAFVLTIGFAVLAVAPAHSLAHPPNETAHGVDAETFATLWSGDIDRTNATHNHTGTDESAIETLAAQTDIPFNEPPAAVEQWNRRDVREFPAGDGQSAIHPPGAELTHGRTIVDAGTSIFAVHPSTRAHLSPEENPHYVAPEGTILTTTDYRIRTPRGEHTTDRRVSWQLLEHGYNVTDVRIDGTRTGIHDAGRIQTLPYSLAGYPGDEHTLTVATSVNVTFRKHVEWCRSYDNSSDCTEWANTTTYPTENLTVKDSIDVVEYSLEVVGQYARYPDGDLGLVAYKRDPWLGYSLPGVQVNGVWRFYSARDERWDRLVRHAADGTETMHSPVHPLEVHAYPAVTESTVSPRSTMTILDASGGSMDAPSLPENVNVDVLEAPYTATYRLATRVSTTASYTDVTGHGLVRGETATLEPDRFSETPLRRSELSLAIENTTNGSVTVRARLRDAETGEPIHTAERDGVLIIDGHRVDTGPNGSARVTVSQSSGAFTDRFEPGAWWLSHPGYVGDSDSAVVGGTALSLGAAASQLLVPVSLFLVAVFLVDRITGWHVWPPWRGL